MTFAAGQCWSYRAPAGYEASRFVIGAIVRGDAGGAIVCAAVLGAKGQRADGSTGPVDIPFLAMAEAAFASSVMAADGAATPPPSFSAELARWSADPRGLAFFTVPFEATLERTIGRQMETIISART